jgi:single-strand DNA-binding protein
MIIVQLAGRLGKDPESRFTATGQKLTSFSFATSSKKAGKEETVWWRVTIWGDQFDKMMPYIKKGTALLITGEMNKGPEIYTDREGKPQVSQLEITAQIIKFSPFGTPDKDKQNQDQTSSYGGAPSSNSSQQSYGNDTSFGDFASNGATGYGAIGGSGQASNNDETMPF